MGSNVCKKAIPQAMSKANLTACVWSTTKSGGDTAAATRRRQGKVIRMAGAGVTAKVLTGALVQHVVEGAVRHPVCDDDGVRGRRRLAGSQHGEDVRVGKYPGRTTT